MTKTEEAWTARIAAWKTSGKSQGEFAEAEGYALSTFRWWSSRLRQRAGGVATEVPMARVVRSAAPDGKRARAHIVIGVAGARIEVASGFDGALLREVVNALGGER